MSLQDSVSLTMTRTFAGSMQGGGNAKTTRSASWQGAATTGLFGKLVARGTEPTQAVALSATTTHISQIFGVVVNDMLGQAPIGGGDVTIEQHDALPIMTNGAITMQRDNSELSVGGDIFVITSDEATPANVGKLTSSKTAGDSRIQVAGVALATNLIQIYDHMTAGSTDHVNVQINHI